MTVAIIKKQKADETLILPPVAEGETEPKPVPNSEELYAETHSIFTAIAEKDGADERAAPLALIELEVRRRKEGIEIGMFLAKSDLNNLGLFLLITCKLRWNRTLFLRFCASISPRLETKRAVTMI
jgi:hypothetical protein